MTALGAGVCGGERRRDLLHHRLDRRPHARHVGSTACTLNAERSGYVITLPSPGLVVQMQTNMAASLNIDWVLGLAADVLKPTRARRERSRSRRAHRRLARRQPNPAQIALSPLHLRSRRARAVRQCAARARASSASPPATASPISCARSSRASASRCAIATRRWAPLPRRAPAYRRRGALARPARASSPPPSMRRCACPRAKRRARRARR